MLVRNYPTASLCLLLFVFLLASCGPNRQVSLAEKLMAERLTDSAIAVMESIEDPLRLSDRDYALYALLRAEASHRKGELTASTDTLLLPAINYFTRSGDSAYAERALYCKGHLERRLYRMEASIQSFLRALLFLQDRQDYEQLYRVNTWLGVVCMNQGDYVAKVKYSKAALQAALNLGNVFYKNMALCDISALSYSEKKNRLTVVACEGHKGMIRHYFDKEEEEIRKKLEARLPGYDVSITSQSRDENIRLIHAGNDRTYGTYYLYDGKENKLTKVADIAPWIKEEEMCAMNPITYTSRDGLTIEGYLTLPKGYTMENAKNLPVVVNPHGGPWARDSWGYNPEVQFLASRGYAVLQMNFRASTGYGRKFTELGYKQWGQAMQNDITDGVEWLIKKGIADPKRVAIYGASYGGYATLAGVTFTPDLYACAVDYVGVSNLLSFMNTIPPYWKPLLDMMHEMVGDPETDKEMMEKYSPVFHVDQIKAPLFIAQGANDPRVNKAESDQMVEALKKRGVEVEYMVKENEGHGFYNEENKFDFYRAMEKFLDKYLK